MVLCSEYISNELEINRIMEMDKNVEHFFFALLEIVVLFFSLSRHIYFN